MASTNAYHDDAIVAVLIVTYNRLDKLKTTISSYHKESVDQIFVVDNNSADGTEEWLKAKQKDDKRLHVLRLHHNAGGAGGFQAGLRWADGYLQGQGWILLQDDDAYPVPGVTADFRQRLEKGAYAGCAAVAAAVLTPNGQPADINRPILNIFRYPWECAKRIHGKIANLRDLYHVPYSDLIDTNTCYRVHAASFVGLYLNLERLPSSAQERYPESDLFIYGDDTIYTASLSHRNLVVLFDSSLRYVHDTATGYQEGILRPEWKHYYISRNSLRVYCAISPWAGPLLYLLALIIRLKRIIRTQDAGLQARSARAYWLGLVDALRGRRFRKHEEVVRYVGISRE